MTRLTVAGTPSPLFPISRHAEGFRMTFITAHPWVEGETLGEHLEKQGVTRRDFLTFCGEMCAMLGLSATLQPKVAAALYLGREGQLAPDTNKYGNTRTMAYLYGAPAQLVVLKSAGIASAHQLAGKKVAVGNAGSGAALSAERFFKTMGIWEKMEPQFLGYAAAVSAFRDRQIDAFWVLVAIPTPQSWKPLPRPRSFWWT